MENRNSNKRLKLSNGASIKRSPRNSAVSNLPLYQPPAAIGLGARGGSSPTVPRPSASIARPANGKTSLRLTVKAAPSKLRQATSGSQIAAPIPPNPYADNASESDATPAPVIRTARSTRNPRTVVEPESEEEDEEEEEEEEEEPEPEPEEDDDDEEDEVEDDEQVVDADGSDQELEDADDSEEDAEGEEASDEDMDDADMDDHPPPPIIKTTNPLGRTKPNVTVTAPPEGPLQSVEDKEMEDDEEEELSELDSNENDDEGEEGEEEEDDSSEGDSDSSRGATPDLSKLTRRQRGLYEEAGAGLMALSNEAQKKKHLTAEEHAMRRAEMARRRKNLSEKRNEEEKMDTINKLLKKPAPKRRTRAEIIAAQQAGYMATPGAEEGEEERADPLFVRWVQSREGSRLGVPDEWMELDGVVGEVFRTGWRGGSGRMVEEVA